MINIQPNNEKITKQRINEFEQKIKYILPKDYFNFLLKNNGGKPEMNLCNVKDYKQISVNYFFGLDLKVRTNELNYALSVFNNRIPKGYIPIASAEGGNLICINLASDTNTIYFWNHEEESEEGEEPTIKNMYKIADNFTNFLEMLEKFDASKVKVKKDDVVSSWIDPEFLKEIQKK
jgi:hypothetical protein